MESFFVRHTKKMAVVEEAINHLWEHDKIAIHFPEVNVKAPKEVEDEASIDENDYKTRAAKRAVSTFRYLYTHGGYIWAEYRNKNDIKVGKIVPNSFEIYETKYTLGWFSYERKAKLKTLQIDKKSVKTISSSEALSLRAARPRQGTITRWPSAKNRLMSLVEGIPPEKCWDSLFPSEQETVCSEYLRNPDACECPVLEHLLLPVGRTLKNVDIFGYTTDKKMLFAQVTYDKKEDAAGKIESLKVYDHPKAHLVFFCDCECMEFEDNILFIPWKRVEHWLKKDEAYLQKLFANLNK